MNAFSRTLSFCLGLLPLLGVAECLAADSHGGAGGTQNPVSGNNPDLAVVTAIIFLVLLAVLWKFAWGPIMDGLKKREEAIAGEIASAERNNEQAQQLLADYKSQLASAADEVRGLLDEGRRDAETQRQQIVAEAQEAARAEKDRAVREIDVAKNEAISELAEKSVSTAVDLAGRIVGSQLEPADHTRLIQEALEKFPSQN